jgi:hypothetical protein
MYWDSLDFLSLQSTNVRFGFFFLRDSAITNSPNLPNLTYAIAYWYVGCLLTPAGGCQAGSVIQRSVENVNMLVILYTFM